MSIISVYICCKDKDEAQNISDGLLGKKLIACSNIFPIQSNFVWKGEFVNEEEIVCLCKSVPENWAGILTEVRRIHSYEVPCIIKYDAEANPEYDTWVIEQCKTE